MSLPKPTRLAGVALTAGGVVMSVCYVLKDAAGDAIDGPLVTAAILTNIAGVLLMMLGLPAWYAAQAHRVRVAGLIAFLAVFTGFPVLEISSSAFAAVMPEIESALAGTAIEEATPLMTGLFAYGLIAANLGLVALGICTLVAKVLPRPAAWTVTLGPFLVFVPLEIPFGEAVALSVTFLGVSWVGLALARGQVRARETAPATAAAVV